MSSSNKNYAKRLIVLSRKLDKSDLFFENIKLINDAFNKEPEISRFINSVDNTVEEKIEYLKNKVSADLDDTVLVELLKMCEQSPFEYTAANLVHDYIDEYYGDQGVTFGVVYSARDVDEDQLEALQDVFSEKLGYDVVLENIVSNGLIGGVKVVIDDQIFDGTYRSKVDSLKRSLKNEDEEITETNISSKIAKSVNEFENTGVKIQSPNTTGYVTSFADGIIHIKGVNYAMASEILYVGSGKAMVMDLKEDEIAAIQLDDKEPISNGTEVSLTGKVVEVPVGDELIGRVVNALGVPIDGKGSLKTSQSAPVEVEAPGIIDRSSVNEPLETGIKMIDSMIPIGKGQRELIIGDRQTGKTAIAIDTILNQKGNNVKCIYVAIGQKNSSVAQIIDKLEQANAMSYTTVVVASASDLPALQYLAPYSGCAIGEYWMKKGEDVLIIYDDLSKHAIAYRTISLLLRRPPGREAYPGDIFYLHSRLLERSGKLSKELGMGSLTALPIIETQAGDISAYIPTNVISITDGQIFLQSDLFNSGIRPAIDYGLSVSRVGGSAQRKAMRKVSSSLKLDLSQYQEVLSFAKFGSDLDEDTRNTISHGQHLTELLKQGQYQPVPMEEMAVLLFANTIGLIDKVSLDKIRAFETSLLEEMRTRHRDVLDEIETTFVISDEVSDKLKVILNEFVDNFNTINN